MSSLQLAACSAHWSQIPVAQHNILRYSFCFLLCLYPQRSGISFGWCLDHTQAFNTIVCLDQIWSQDPWTLYSKLLPHSGRYQGTRDQWGCPELVHPLTDPRSNSQSIRLANSMIPRGHTLTIGPGISIQWRRQTSCGVTLDLPVILSF